MTAEQCTGYTRLLMSLERSVFTANSFQNCLEQDFEGEREGGGKAKVRATARPVTVMW